MDLEKLKATLASLREIAAERPDDELAKRTVAEYEKRLADATAATDAARDAEHGAAAAKEAEAAAKREAARKAQSRAVAMRALAEAALADAEAAEAAANAAANELAS